MTHIDTRRIKYRVPLSKKLNIDEDFAKNNSNINLVDFKNYNKKRQKHNLVVDNIS